MNTVIAVKPVPAELQDAERSSPPGSRPPSAAHLDDGLALPLRVTNTGRSYWPPDRSARPAYGLGDHRALPCSAKRRAGSSFPAGPSHDRSLPESRPRSSSGYPGRP